MANKDNNNMNLQIQSKVLELKNLVQTIVEELKNLKELKEVIIGNDDLEDFKATIKELEEKQEEIERKLKLLLHSFKKEEALEEVLVRKIEETRKKWMQEAENKQKVLKGWLKKQGSELSRLLIIFLRLVLLDMEEEEKFELIKRVRSLLKLRSIGENYKCSPVIDGFISVMKLGVENVELPRSKTITKLCGESERDELLGLILEEVSHLEIVFNYPSLYPEMSKTKALDQIRQKVHGIYIKFLYHRFVDVISHKILEKLRLEFEKIWEELDIPGIGLMASDDGNNINLRIRRNFLELKNLIRSMEQEIDYVKILGRGISRHLRLQLKNWIKKWKISRESSSSW